MAKRKQKFEKDTIFRMSSDIMKTLGIPNITLEDEHPEEFWTYVHGPDGKMKKIGKDRRYMVSNYARVYDTLKKKMVIAKPSKFFKSKVSSYYEINFKISDGSSFGTFLHRVVALSFIDNPEHKPIVNHKDGNSSHNYLWNLEWNTVAENMNHAISNGLKNEQRGEERSNSLWKDSEIHMICKLMEEGHKATYIYNIMSDILKDPKVEYERVRTLYKHIIKQTHWTHISKLYDIDFTRFNYSKEQSSVRKAEERKLAKETEIKASGELKPL